MNQIKSIPVPSCFSCYEDKSQCQGCTMILDCKDAAQALNLPINWLNGFSRNSWNLK